MLIHALPYFMLNLIEKLSHYIAKKISNTDTDNENYDYYQYSIHGLLSFGLYFIIAVILSFIFGYFPYILLIIPILLNVRSQCGGSHALSSFWCMVATSFWYFVIGMSTIHLNAFYILLFILSFVAWTGLSEIPKYTKTATRHREERQKEFKKKYITRLSLVFIANGIFILLTLMNVVDLSKFSTLLSMAVLVNRFSLSNWSFKLFEWLG